MYTVKPDAGDLTATSIYGADLTDCFVSVTDGNVLVALVTGDSTAEALKTAQVFAAAPRLMLELQMAVARVELANAEGNPILSAWLTGAKSALAASGLAEA